MRSNAMRNALWIVIAIVALFLGFIVVYALSQTEQPNAAATSEQTPGVPS